jgi:hypothetical protein
MLDLEELSERSPMLADLTLPPKNESLAKCVNSSKEKRG